MSDTARLLDFGAVAAFRAQLHRSAVETLDLLERVGAQLRQFRDAAEQQRDACRQNVEAATLVLEAAIHACRQDERACGAVGPAKAGLGRAVAEKNRVDGLVRALDDAVARHYGPMRRYAGAVSNTTQAIAVLDQIGRASADYRSVALPAGLGGGVASPESLGAARSVSPGPAPKVAEPIGATGMVAVPLSAIDSTDSMVTGPESYQKVSYPEMQRGVHVLDEVVLPAVRAGADGDHFSRMDAASGVPYTDGTRRIYDAFFGDSGPVTLNRVGDRYTVTNGNHRIFIARRLGLTTLPARVLG